MGHNQWLELANLKLFSFRLCVYLVELLEVELPYLFSLFTNLGIEFL